VSFAPSVGANRFVRVPGAVATSPNPSDVVLAILGASAGVAGLVLVFVGILVTAIAGYPGGTSTRTLRPFRLAAWASVCVFGLSLLTTALSLLWLAVTDAHSLYVATIALFLGLLLALLALAAAVVKETI
jgi:hypothetical protein